MLVDELATTYPSLAQLYDAVKYHHEYYNDIYKRGYPDHMEGENIPPIARMVALADSWDAMTTSRSYNEAKTFEEAIIEIASCAGTQFDPDLAYEFTKSICIPRTIPDVDLGTTITEGIATSPEGFKNGCETMDYNYSNPPTYDGTVKLNLPNRNYKPDYEAIKVFVQQHLKDKESYINFVESIHQNDSIMKNRRSLLFDVTKKITDIKKELTDPTISDSKRGFLQKEFEHYNQVRIESSSSVLRNGLSEKSNEILKEPIQPEYAI